MTDDIIDQAISEATIEAPAETVTEEPIENTEEPAEVENTEEVAEEQATKESTEEPKVQEEVAFPKKAVNALSRRDKQIGKLQAQLAAERSELQKLREQAEKSQAADIPKEDSFDNYGDYMKAVARHELKQESTQEKKEQLEAQELASEQGLVEEQVRNVNEKAEIARNDIPDYQQLFTENADVLQSLPPHIEKVFLEAEEPALAFYALAKEGKLESILDMSPARAAMAIGRAEVRGAELSKAKPVTKAPAPIASLKGAGKTSKTANTMTPRELLDWVNS